MKKLINKITGRVKPLEEICAWKGISETEHQKEGDLRVCNLCDGYKITCPDYSVKCTTKLKKNYDY